MSTNAKTKAWIFLYECPECGSLMPIPKKVSRAKKAGHRKWLWCPKCKKSTNHIQLPR